VSEDYILKGMKLLLLEGKVLCEPTSGINIGAVMQGLIPVKSTDKVCFLFPGVAFLWNKSKSWKMLRYRTQTYPQTAVELLRLFCYN